MGLKHKQPLLLSGGAATLVVAVGVFLILRQGAPMLSAGPAERIRPPASAVAPAARDAPVASTSPQLSAPPAAGSGIFRCTVNGTTVYADSPCPAGKELDIRISQGFLPPPASLQTRPAPNVEVRASSARPDAGQARNEATAASSRCALLVKQIEAIDAAARRGGSARYQDDLREKRRKLVDKRYEWKC